MPKRIAICDIIGKFNSSIHDGWSGMVDHTKEPDQTFNRRLILKLLGVTGIASVGVSSSAVAGTKADGSNFDLVEATIGDIHAGFIDGQITAEELVEQYIARIDAYDDAINSIITLNTEAKDRAAELDDQFDKSGLQGPLHGIPIILKDNYDTKDLPATAGSLTLEESIPPDDAYIVSQMRDAGGIILGKANMDEWASGGIGYSSLGGQTHNPYALNRIPGGSSAGSAAAIAANLGAVGTGTDTGGSMREPAAHTNLVALRATQGLVSRDGIIPLSDTQDMGGPMTRTVSDTARILDVIAGYDPDDQQTAQSVGKIPSEGYTAHLKKDGLDGAQVGVLRGDLVESVDEEVTEVIDQAVEDMEGQGASVVDPLDLPSSLLELAADASVANDYEPKRELNEYFTTLGPNAPDTLEDVVEGEYINSENYEGPIIQNEIEYQEVDVESLDENPEYLRVLTKRDEVQELVYKTMADNDLDAIVFPTLVEPPAEIGEETAGASSRNISPATGFPDLTVPAGFSRTEQLPVGIDFLGKPFSEPELIEYAYSYEQATLHRHPPKKFGSLNEQ